MDMKKFLLAVDGAPSAAKPDPTDMKKFLSIVSEGKNPATNRLSMAEQMAVDHYTKYTPEETPKKRAPSLIAKYVESVEQETHQLRESQLEKAYKISQKVMEKMYPGSLTRHLSQSQRPSASVTRAAKASSARMIGEEDTPDTVTVDIPLLIRLLEYAREDAKTDMDLHTATENLINLSKENNVLSMDHYEAIVGTQKQLPAPDAEM